LKEKKALQNYITFLNYWRCHHLEQEKFLLRKKINSITWNSVFLLRNDFKNKIMSLRRILLAFLMRGTLFLGGER